MKKHVKVKIIILLSAFVVTCVATFVSMYYRETEPAFTTMTEATLPILYMQTEGGKLINPAYGYTVKVDGAGLFNGITPLDENRNVNAIIYNYGEKIMSVSYRVIEIETDTLLEDTEIRDFSVHEGYVQAELNIKNLIEKDRQYLLEILISTTKHEDITYFERILWSDKLYADSKIDFTLKFNGYTYDTDNLSEISQWIETDGTGDNTNYGKVSIHSTAEQIGWGELGAMAEGDITPIILDINSSTAQICLKYKAATPCTGTLYDSYNVSDYYRIRQVGEDKFYLLSYEREANQIFDGNEDLQASGRINLGIKESNENCESMSDNAGNYSYFVDSGQLWCYSRPDNKFTNVFSFNSADSNGYRELNDDHEINILDVEDKGNAVFIVYGYMNRGKHEGSLGISLYRYDYSENIVNEEIFIPLDMTFNIMCANVGDIAYISGDQFYIKIGHVLYSIDLISKEMMIVTEGLYEGTYSVNEDGTRLAYHYNHTVEDDSRIRVINFLDGTEHVIEVDDYGVNPGYDRIKVIGYIKNDIVFGICDKRDITAIDGVNGIFPMYGIYILDDEYELVKDYKEDNLYVIKAVINGMRVNLTRMVRNDDGRFVNTSIDQLMNRKENNQQSGLYTEVVTTKVRKKEIYLNLPSSAGRTDSVSLRYSKKVIYDAGTSFEINDDFGNNEEYIAYGHGKCLGAYTNLTDAIRAASDDEGIVLDINGNYAWNMTQLLNTIIWNDAYSVLETYDFNVNLTGLAMENILYFISSGKFVMARAGEDNYVIIYDYDNNNIYYYDKLKAGLSVSSREDAEKLFTEWGNVFLVTK